MSSEQPRRAREVGGSGGSPTGSTVAIIIAVVAVVAGFLILRQIRDDGGDNATPPVGTSATATSPQGTTDGTGSTSPSETTGLPGESTTTVSVAPTTPPAQTTGALVVVANASNVDRAAGRFSTALQGKQFTTGTPMTATVDLPVSVVYYVVDDANAKAVANYLASLLGGISVEPMPTEPPVQANDDGTGLDAGTTVLLMLGQDKAGKTLEEAGAPSTSAPAGTGSSSPSTSAATTTT